MKKLFFFIALLALAAFLSWRAFSTVRTQEKTKAPSGSPPVSVEVEVVRHAPLQEVQQLTGAIQPSFRYVVASRIPGRAMVTRIPT